MATLAEQNPKITSFLQRNHTAVLATANKETGQPHGAVVYYTVSSSFHLFFVTKRDTAKSRNIEANPQVAMVIYEADTQSTVQLYGTASSIDDPQKLQSALAMMAGHAKATAQTDALPVDKLNAGDYLLYQVVPRNIRLAEYKYGAGDNIFEVVVPNEPTL
jgi:general stress protein 26